jgi:hypothetical protein
MRSSLASLMGDESTSSAAGGAHSGGRASGASETDFRGAIAAAAAAQVFADGLAAMWAAPSATGAARRRALLASITDRADGLAARATAKTDRPGTAGGFAQAAVSIRDLAARRTRAADALTRRFAGPDTSQA